MYTFYVPETVILHHIARGQPPFQNPGNAALPSSHLTSSANLQAPRTGSRKMGLKVTNHPL